MSLIENIDTPEDVERLLVEARKNLQAFEDGVDNKRLLDRLKASSPAHPILILRVATLAMTVLLLTAALAVVAAAMLNPDLARMIAPFDAAVPLPGFLPDNLGLPALLALLALLMGVAWFMATQAALFMGRDAAMLGWEQKQHQKLVNELTRLTTQKAVMERIKNTPQGARPRINTPIPVSMRGRGPAPASPSLSPPGLGLSIPPSDLGGGRKPATLSGGLRGAPESPASRPPTPRLAAPVGNPIPGGSIPPGPLPGRQGLAAPKPAFGTPSNAPYSGNNAQLGGPDDSPSMPPGLPPIPRGAPFQASSSPSYPPRPSPPVGGGLLSRARNTGGTPTPMANRAAPPPMSASSPPGPSPFASPGRAPQQQGVQAALKPRFNVPETFPDVADIEEEVAPRRPPAKGFQVTQSRGAPELEQVLVDDMDEQVPPPAPPARPAAGVRVGGASRPVSAAPAAAPAPASPMVEDMSDVVALDDGDAPEGGTRFGPIRDAWLRSVVEQGEALAASFPPQVRLEYSQEENVPFSLVISRATPAMAVRSLLQFVEFLASGPVPQQARIELVGVPQLDKSFHRNVQAALEPHFGDRFQFENEPGRIEIFFTEPDPRWQAWPMLPVQRD